jgi:hypothetical protein
VYSGNSNGGIVALGGGSVNVDSSIVTNNGVGLYSGAEGFIGVASSFISGNNTGEQGGQRQVSAPPLSCAKVKAGDMQCR